MSKKQLKLLCPVFHNDRELVADNFLFIPDEITEDDANKLIKLGVAKYEIVKKAKGTTDDNDKIDINSLTRDELETELTVRAIDFTLEQSDDELRQLLIDDESDNDE